MNTYMKRPTSLQSAIFICMVSLLICFITIFHPGLHTYSSSTKVKSLSERAFGLLGTSFTRCVQYVTQQPIK
jgi:hypothetical protein